MAFTDKNILDPISLNMKDLYEEYNYLDYISKDNKYNSRIPSDKQNEDALKNDYSGRELYEIIQNADDQKAQNIEIELDDKSHLHIRNDGGKPFSNKGLLSVMRPHQSGKKQMIGNLSETPIGNKGLGIRSLLNWSDGMIIHSNGVKVEFSQVIADEKWISIKKEAPDLASLQEANNGKCPLAILSVPKVSRDDITKSGNQGQWTTEIEIKCHDKVLEDVKDKMSGLQPEVLLFLHNVDSIVLNIHGVTRQLKKEGGSSNDLGHPEMKSLVLKEGSVSFEYKVFSRNEDDEIEVAVAFSTNQERYCDFLYSYFPTRINLSLPCALHANFQLNMSRDGLIVSETNDKIMASLGKLLVETAAKRALAMSEGKAGLSKLLPLKMLLIGPNAERTLPAFAKIIHERFASTKVIPTIDGQFKSLNDEIYFSEGVELTAFKKYFDEKSLLNNYIETETYKCLLDYNQNLNGLGSLTKELSEIASKIPTIEDLGDLICALMNVKQWGTPPNLLKLEDGSIADADTTVYVLESKDVSRAADSSSNQYAVPRGLEFRVLNSALSKYLQEKLKVDSRDLTKNLKVIAHASDADFSHVKAEIEKQSTKMDDKKLLEILLWLYHRWKNYQSSSDKNEAPDCFKFHLINATGKYKPVCSLLLECDNEEYELRKSLQEIINESDREVFFRNYLGCAQALPVEMVDFYQENDYITKAGADPYYVQKLGKDHNLAYIPVADFLNELSCEKILSLILKDERFFCEMVSNRDIKYQYYSIQNRTAPFSYAVYWLSKRESAPLANIVNYVIPSALTFDASILNEGILKVEEIEGPKDRLNELLEQLGAKNNPTDLSYAQIYSLLESKSTDDKVQTFYRELRSLIIAKQRLEHSAPTDSDKSILSMVWASGPGGIKRMPKEEVYYWDNSKLPRRFLDSLWKLCLPSRTGEKSVQEIFGIRLLSDIDLDVLNPEEYNHDVTCEVVDFLRKRFKLLVAASLAGGEYKVETIKLKAAQIRSFFDSLRICNSILYNFDGSQYNASEGEVVSDKDCFYICTQASSPEEIQRNPRLISNLAKGLCLKLLVDVDNEIWFKHVIQASTVDLDFEWNELDETLRQDVMQTIGISDHEKLFWESLGVILDEDNDSDPSIRKSKILSQYPNIKLPQSYVDVQDMPGRDLYALLSSLKEDELKKVMGLYSLKQYYSDQLQGERERIYNNYRKCTFLETKKNLEKEHSLQIINEWNTKLNEFDQRLKEFQFQIPEAYQNLDKLYISFKKQFKAHLSESIGAGVCDDNPTILPQYETIMRKHNVSESELDTSVLVMTYFEGFDHEFEDKINAKISQTTYVDTNTDKLTQSEDSITFVKTGKTGSARNSYGGGFKNSQTKDRVGKSAEKRVREFLESHPEQYEDIVDVAKRYEYHCDILYKLKGDPVQRYLEVKSVNGHKIFFTPAEIDKATGNSEYDLAVVYGDKVKIIHSAFKGENELMQNCTPSGFEVNIDFSVPPRK